ncbi:MAG: membrane protein insertase YidC, partial [Hyphomicrobium sp.]|nr:membrane protein insertase YidC [Hyphomicrobium sp.]
MKSQDPDQQRNLLLAVVLSMAVLLGWQLFYAGPKMKQEQARQRAQQELTQKEVTTPDQAKPSAAAPAPGTAVPGTGAATPAPAVSREDSIKVSPRLTVETPSLKGSIALRGGRVDDLLLVKYHETVDPKSPNVVLF